MQFFWARNYNLQVVVKYSLVRNIYCEKNMKMINQSWRRRRKSCFSGEESSLRLRWNKNIRDETDQWPFLIRNSNNVSFTDEWDFGNTGSIKSSICNLLLIYVKTRSLSILSSFKKNLRSISLKFLSLDLV